MENASKALLIAGGVLIAIILITVLVRTYGNISIFQRQQLTEDEIEKIAEENKEYLKYLNQYVYGTEVISIINKVADFQERTGEDFNILITFSSGTIAIKGDESNKYYFLDQYQNNEKLQGIKSKYFLCTSIGYDNSTGRINRIEFIEKQIE